MSKPASDVRTEGIEAQDGSRTTIEVKRSYHPGGDLPPGAVAVTERVLAKYVPPGKVQAPHGVPPIGIIGLPAGWVVSEMFADDSADELEVLPFRFPWYSRAYALRHGDHLFAVLRNVQPNELSPGNQIIVQYNESKDWSTYFGTIGRMTVAGFMLRRPDNTEGEVLHGDIHFAGKVCCWWDERPEMVAKDVRGGEA